MGAKSVLALFREGQAIWRQRVCGRKGRDSICQWRWGWRAARDSFLANNWTRWCF